MTAQRCEGEPAMMPVNDVRPTTSPRWPATVTSHELKYSAAIRSHYASTAPAAPIASKSFVGRPPESRDKWCCQVTVSYDRNSGVGIDAAGG